MNCLLCAGFLDRRQTRAIAGAGAAQQQGNSSRALTHLALISAAFNLDRALGA